MKVLVRKGNFEKALRQFKRNTMDEGIIFEVREKEFYEKPCDKRRRKHKSAVNRQQRKQNADKPSPRTY